VRDYRTGEGAMRDARFDSEAEVVVPAVVVEGTHEWISPHHLRMTPYAARIHFWFLITAPIAQYYQVNRQRILL
jgi:hypothetical protein